MKFLKRTPILLVMLCATLGGCATLKGEKTYLPVEYDRFLYHQWYSGEFLIPDSLKKEKWQIGRREEVIKNCKAVCTISAQYIPANEIKLSLLVRKSKKLYNLLEVDPKQLKMFDGINYIYNPNL